MKNFLALLFVLLTGCSRAPARHLHPGPLETVIVPGCPTNEDGTVSTCQWERAIWASMLWEDGVTRSFITSGGAVYNRYIEAEALQAAMRELGVPADRIHTETQALHSDENIGYSRVIAEFHGFGRIGYASHDAHVSVIKRMVRGWGHRGMPGFRMDLDRVRARAAQGLPLVVTEPVPESEWLPLEERERVVAERTGRARRLPSWLLYGVGFVLGGLTGDEPRPPVPEPSLRGLRHRVDTQGWRSEPLAQR